MDDMTEVRRAKFEAWADEDCLDMIGDEYENPYVQSAWSAWSAALDSVVVDLPMPSMSEYANRNGLNCAVEAIEWAKEAIHAAGVKTA